MNASPHAALSAATARLLRPLVRILLRHGVSFGSFSEVARRVFVEVASRDFAIEGRKQSIARIATLTGLTRKEVSRLLGEGPITDAATAERHNRAARVIGGWLRDTEFCTSTGEPRALTMAGEGSFPMLVKRYSGDMPPRAVLDELLRVGAVEQDAGGRIALRARAYVPSGSEVDQLHMLGTDVGALIETIDNNLAPDDRAPRFQRKVLYDNVPDEALEAFRALAAQRGETLLSELNEWLARHDRDATPGAGGRGRNRAGLGIYYFEAPHEGEDVE